MICERCKHEFCWICLSSVPRHSEFYHFVHRLLTIWVYRILISLIFSFLLLRWLYLWQPTNYLVKGKFDCLKFLLFGWPFTNFEWISLALLVNIILRIFLQYYAKLFNPYKIRRLPEKPTIINKRNVILTVLSLGITYFVQDYVEVPKEILSNWQ